MHKVIFVVRMIALSGALTADHLAGSSIREQREKDKPAIVD
jgi:hypothetical protein